MSTRDATHSIVTRPSCGCARSALEHSWPATFLAVACSSAVALGGVALGARPLNLLRPFGDFGPGREGSCARGVYRCKSSYYELS